MKANAAPLVLAGLLIAGAPVQAEDLFRCQATNSVAITPAGELSSEGGLPAYGLLRWEEFIVDTASGLVRHRGLIEPQKWQILQKGDTGNDTVLAPDVVAAVGTVDILRIRKWEGEPQPVFLVFDVSTLTTGTCEQIQ